MITTLLSNKYLLLVSRIVIGFLFIYAGVVKIGDPQSFADSVANFKILPDYLINLTAIIIPWIELLTGLLLLLGIFVKENAFIIMNLLGIFIILVIVSLFRGLNVDCGCFGTVSGDAIGITKIVEDVLMLLPAIQLFFFGGGSLTLQNLDPNSLTNQY